MTGHVSDRELELLHIIAKIRQVTGTDAASLSDLPNAIGAAIKAAVEKEREGCARQADRAATFYDDQAKKFHWKGNYTAFEQSAYASGRLKSVAQDIRERK
jgi:hypothetical protein